MVRRARVPTLANLLALAVTAASLACLGCVGCGRPVTPAPALTVVSVSPAGPLTAEVQDVVVALSSPVASGTHGWFVTYPSEEVVRATFGMDRTEVLAHLPQPLAPDTPPTRCALVLVASDGSVSLEYKWTVCGARPLAIGAVPATGAVGVLLCGAAGLPAGTGLQVIEAQGDGYRVAPLASDTGVSWPFSPLLVPRDAVCLLPAPCRPDLALTPSSLPNGAAAVVVTLNASRLLAHVSLEGDPTSDEWMRFQREMAFAAAVTLAGYFNPDLRFPGGTPRAVAATLDSLIQGEIGAASSWTRGLDTVVRDKCDRYLGRLSRFVPADIEYWYTHNTKALEGLLDDGAPDAARTAVERGDVATLYDRLIDRYALDARRELRGARECIKDWPPLEGGD